MAGLILSALLAAALLAHPAAAQKKPPKKELYLTLFGQEHLQGIDVVAEVKVVKVTPFGMGVEVVVLKPIEVLSDHLTKAQRRRHPISVLSNKGEFLERTKLLVFLKIFGSGQWYITRKRLEPLDKDYQTKLRVMTHYIEIESIENRSRRVQVLKNFLIENLNVENSWGRWNVLHELQELLRRHATLFSRDDQNAIGAIDRKELPADYRLALASFEKRLEESLDPEKEEHPDTDEDDRERNHDNDLNAPILEGKSDHAALFFFCRTPVDCWRSDLGGGGRCSAERKSNNRRGSGACSATTAQKPLAFTRGLCSQGLPTQHPAPGEP